jgi:ferredoxin
MAGGSPDADRTERDLRTGGEGMTGTIYYFTGTGNSLAAARTIAESLGDMSLVPISSTAGKGAQGLGVTGLVFPLQFCGLPEVVRRFAGRLDLDLSEYTFAVVTRRGGPSRALCQLRDIFGAGGWVLDAGFLLNMPGNYTPLFDVPSREKQAAILEAASGRLSGICAAIRSRATHTDRESMLERMIGHEIYHMWIESIGSRDGRFHLTDGCTSCGVCAGVCPVGNITIEGGRPVWHGRCQQCFACFHFCSEKVIQFGPKTVKRGRYHHPDTRPDDIARQRMGIAENY